MNYFENIKLEKGMYGVAGKSFTDVLEGLDSSENYRDTPLEGLDAYQRQLKRFGIKVSGAGSDKVERFFESSGAAALFPEYVARAVSQGLKQGGIVEDLVATVSNVDSRDYRTMSIESTNSGSGLSTVNEGEEMPAVIIKASPKLIEMTKKGRIIASSYETVRFQRLDLFTVMLRQIGEAIAASQAEEAVKVLENGDGNIGAISKKITSAGLTYDELIDLWGELSPFKFNTIVAGTDAIKQMMTFKEFKDSYAGMNFHGTGELGTPMGAKIVHVPSVSNGLLIGLDKNAALELVQAGDVTVDADKMIDRQIEMAGVSVISGFARIFEGAVKGLGF